MLLILEILNCCLVGDDIKLKQTLIKYKYNENDGITLINSTQDACRFGHLKVIKLMFEFLKKILFKFPLNQRKFLYQGALQSACEGDQTDVIDLLLTDYVNECINYVPEVLTSGDIDDQIKIYTQQIYDDYKKL